MRYFAGLGFSIACACSRLLAFRVVFPAWCGSSCLRVHYAMDVRFTHAAVSTPTLRCDDPRTAYPEQASQIDRTSAEAFGC